ncbi:hypothetical protein B9G69_004460 [Bdellovibrio sp. SKB1291214]|uniref:hypothetical protein n=1 Tax=Bdellovibrio sp. SKB1291214 TaxID=1732569 RepID=UPI000B51CFEB|nr:hypothetical protein [Bdellovibrio sp. SKB1291214]UYL09827.1 hypothetical protein B9G69_004460 [Bdellovibrio sp. SKB1291214]
MSHTYPTLVHALEILWEILKVSGIFLAVAFVLHHLSGFLRLKLSETFGQHAFNLIFAPGIMIHEISHAVAAFLFLHQIEDIKLFDWKAKDGSHGHVISRPRNVPWLFKIWIKMGELFIGIAPLIVGPLLCAAVFYYFIPGGKTFTHNPRFINFPSFSWSLIAWWYLVIAVFSQMELSDADLKGTWKGYLWIVLTTFAVALISFKLRQMVRI